MFELDGFTCSSKKFVRVCRGVIQTTLKQSLQPLIPPTLDKKINQYPKIWSI
jgi:hypothetical protein